MVNSLSFGNELDVVGGLSLMANEYRGSANYRASRVVLSRAVLMEERARGSEHPDRAINLASEALAIYLSGDSLSALQPALRAESLGREGLRLKLRTLTEERALKEATSKCACLDLLITLATINPDERMAARVWDGVIRSRVLVLDEVASRHRDIAGRRDSSLKAIVESLGSANSRCAALLWMLLETLR